MACRISRSVRYRTLFAVVLFGSTVFAQTVTQRGTPPMSNHYAVILEEPAVIDRFPTREGTRSLAAQTYRQQIEAHQQTLRTELEARRFPVVGSVSTSSNALFVISTPDRVSELQSVPGVAGVVRMRKVQAKLNHATTLMNAPAAWTALGGPSNAGKGIKVAVIDSGIDQTHAAFQDSSLTMPAGFPLCTTGHPEDCSYTNSKVIVAKSYLRADGAPSDPKNPAADSLPDDFSPRDRVGHGTAVASALGANQNSGPAVGFTGMAPKVYLGNYKVLGQIAGGSEDSLIAALNDAFADGFDIANVSLGALATTGPLDTGAACGNPVGVACDLLAQSAEKLAQGGMVIVAAAGNDGYSGQTFPTFNMISSPSNAPSVISVGGTMNDHVFEPSVSVSGGPSNLQNIAAHNSDAYSASGVTSPTSAPLIDVSTLGNDGYACTALPAYSLYNSYALIERGPATNACSFNVKATNAANAGAIGIVFYMLDSSTTVTPELQDSSGSVPLYAPVVMISNSAGVALKSYLAAHPGAVVTLDPAGTETSLTAYNAEWGFSPVLAGNQYAPLSSPGPNTGDFAVKPDIVATEGGDPLYLELPDPNNFNLFGLSGLYVATQSYDPGGQLYSPNGYVAVDGTSLATPLVAGAAALVWQMHPKYTAAQVRSALINSSAQDSTTDVYGDPVNGVEVGAGRLDAGAAVSATVVSSPVSLTFGNLKGATLPLTKTIQLTNLGSAAVNLTIAVSKPTDLFNGAATATTAAVDKSTLSLAAGATASVNVTLSGTLPSAGQYAGTVTVSGTGVSLHIPYLALMPDGVIYDMIAVQGSQATTYNSCFEGLAGQDIGPVGIKLIDDYGMPVTGQAVRFTVSPRGSVTLASAPGEPACSPASSGSATTCASDSYGIAYAEVTMGSSLTSTPTITASAGSMTFTFGIDGFGNNCGQVLAQPAITGVSEAAVGSTNIAAGSYISIYGSNLVNPLAVTAVAPAYGDSASYLPLPLSLDGVTVSFDVPGAYDGTPSHYNGLPGYFTFVGNAGTQLNLQIPWELQGKSSVLVKVTVDYTGISNVLTIPLVQYAPQLFQNSGQVAAIDSTTYAASPTPISATNPAHSGDLVELFGNGLGPVNNQPNSGEGAKATPALPSTKSTVTVTIGGQPATVQYAGLAPGFPGLYQINVFVPSGLAAGNQPVVISVGGQSSKSATIPIK